jgi:hypothetical protein
VPVSRRVSLPGADALFGGRPDAEEEPGTNGSKPPAVRPDSPGTASPSGRVRHDEKITVYMSMDELLDLEHARLMLRRDHALAVDRGRIVRESLSLALHELEAGGADSPLVRRLRGVS